MDMDLDTFRVRPIRAADLDAAVQLVQLANPDYTPAELDGTRAVMELAASGEDNEVARRGVILVAEEKATGRVVGVATAGTPGEWVRDAVTKMPAEAVIQLRERLGEVYEVAAHPDFRRRGIGTHLMNRVPGEPVARSWRAMIWFFHGDALAFHEGMTEMWEPGSLISFMEPGGVVCPFRELDDDLYACIGPLYPGMGHVTDKVTGHRAIRGLFTGTPWPVTGTSRPPRTARGTKADRKREKKARGRARG